MTILDSVKDYAEMMQEIFDFESIKKLLSGELTGQKFHLLLDSMHGGLFSPYFFLIPADAKDIIIDINHMFSDGEFL